jgi:hypothetical protein
MKDSEMDQSISLIQNTFSNMNNITSSLDDHGFGSDSYEETKTKSKKKPQKKKSEKGEENFPISIEDLEFLEKNYISENKIDENNMAASRSRRSTAGKRKIKSPYDVIVIDKKKMVIEDDFDMDWDRDFIKNDKKQENLITKDEKPDSFNQKLFDYKSFNSNQNSLSENKKSFPNLSNSNNKIQSQNSLLNNLNNLNNFNPHSEHTNWLSKQNEEKKEYKNNDILPSINLNDINILSDEYSLSMVDSPTPTTTNMVENNQGKNLAKKSKEEIEEKELPADKKTRFADFIKSKKEKLLENPDILPKRNNVNKKEDSADKISKLFFIILFFIFLIFRV